MRGAPPESRRPERASKDRAVSPVIGVVLMAAIVVLLAAVVGTMALGFEESLVEPTPTADFDADYDSAGEGNNGTAYANLSFDSGTTLDGNRVYVADSDGNSVPWVDIWFGDEDVEPGAFVHVDGAGSDCALNPATEGEVYRILWGRTDGSREILAEHEIRDPPENPPGSTDCSD